MVSTNQIFQGSSTFVDEQAGILNSLVSGLGSLSRGFQRVVLGSSYDLNAHAFVDRLAPVDARVNLASEAKDFIDRELGDFFTKHSHVSKESHGLGAKIVYGGTTTTSSQAFAVNLEIKGSELTYETRAGIKANLDDFANALCVGSKVSNTDDGGLAVRVSPVAYDVKTNNITEFQNSAGIIVSAKERLSGILENIEQLLDTRRSEEIGSQNTFHTAKLEQAQDKGLTGHKGGRQ